MSLLFSTGAFASSLSGAAPGMVLLTPTSITHSGTSASIGANGQVTFSAVTSLSLNGVFSADFDNYVVSSYLDMASDGGVRYHLRSSGSDILGTEYTIQMIGAESTSVSAARYASQDHGDVAYFSTNQNGFILNIYGPYLSQPTAFRSVTVTSYGTAHMQENVVTHSLSTGYDGLTFYATPAFTGALQVYGVRS